MHVYGWTHRHAHSFYRPYHLTHHGPSIDQSNHSIPTHLGLRRQLGQLAHVGRVVRAEDRDAALWVIVCRTKCICTSDPSINKKPGRAGPAMRRRASITRPHTIITQSTSKPNPRTLHRRLDRDGGAARLAEAGGEGAAAVGGREQARRCWEPLWW